VGKKKVIEGATATDKVIRVGKAVAGRGVFARFDLPAGQHLGQALGRVIDDPEYTSSYCIELSETASLEPYAPFRFLNHCCVPNSQLYVVECEYEDGSPAPNEIHVETLKAVKAGEEITIDYSWSAHAAIRCLCGHPACRKWVVAAEELPELLAKKAKVAAKAREARKQRNEKKLLGAAK
jgi:uncharacterized protein